MYLRFMLILLGVTIASVECSSDQEVKTEEDLGVKYANRCEVCKVLATELQNRLEETGKVHDVIEIGYSLDDVQPKKKTKYQKSELRLIESLDGVCEKILEYNIHKERKDSNRFAKGMSQTFKTLHGLVDKGVKVDLGIPYELWDKPSAEITHLKTQCESLLEENEDAIEYWYWNLQGTKDLKTHLCEDNALTSAEYSCLYDNGNLKGDNGQTFDTKVADLNDNSESSNQPEEKEKEFQYNLESDPELAMEIYEKNMYEPYGLKKPGEEEEKEETDRQKAAKEKFARLYESGSLDFDDPDQYIEFSRSRRVKGEYDNSIYKRIKEQKLKKLHHINDEFLKKPVPKNYVLAEPTTEFDWSGDGGNPLPKKWVNVDETKKAHKGDEFISKRDEL